MTQQDRPDAAGTAARLRMRGALLSLTIIVNILGIYLAQSETAVGWIRALLDRMGADAGGFAAANEGYSLLLYLTVFLLPYLAYARVVGLRAREIPHEPPHPPVLAACTGLSLALSVVGVTLSILTAAAFARFGFYPADLPSDIPAQPIAAVLYFVNATILPALVEELTYRGVVLTSLRPYGDRFAIVVSAVLFALLHRNMTQFPNALLLGLALGYFFVKTRSIWTSIAIHFANNLLVLLLSLVTAGMDPVGAWIAQGMQAALYLTAGWLGFRCLFLTRRAEWRLAPSGGPLRERSCFRRFFLSFPMLLLLALYARIFYLSFTRV